MKKTLVALAALASVSVFAQTTVVIDGFIDRGYLALNSTADASDLKTIGSNSGTTTVGIKVNQDLGGGLTAGLSVNTDWSELAGATQGGAVANAGTSGFANSQSFMHITSKDFGVLRLGAPNLMTLTNATAISSPAFSTGVGSQYSSIYSITSGLGHGASGRGSTVDTSVYANGTTAITAGTANHTTSRAVRQANTVQYSSPTMGGVSVTLSYSQMNNNVTASSGMANTAGMTETALRYTNGPIDAMYTTVKISIGSNGINNYQQGTASAVTMLSDANAQQTSTYNLLGANYQVMPNLKLNVGSGTFNSSLGVANGSHKNYGGTFNMGQFDFMLLMSATNDTTTTNIDRKMTGMGLNYNLSKTARAYIRTDNANYYSNGAAVAGSSVKRTALGFSKSF